DNCARFLQRCFAAGHCEELLRLSNPDFCRGGSLDCFAALAMTVSMQRMHLSAAFLRPSRNRPEFNSPLTNLFANI
ncbi:hypothetical protein, partial [Acinetobacter baumannii]|uniref:hypothetical protein n=1 Tax=Acinetobacter baumannii TaxID=470 RepID=UPI001C0FD7AA